MKLRTVFAACLVAASVVVTPGAAQAEVAAGCAPATEVRSEGIFYGSQKAAQIKLLRAQCPMGVKFFAKTVIMDQWTSLGYRWSIQARLRVGNTWVSEGGWTEAPDRDVMSPGVFKTCGSGIEAFGTVDVVRGDVVVATVKNDTLPCNG